MFVFYYIRYSCRKLFGRLYGPSDCDKHISLRRRAASSQMRSVSRRRLGFWLGSRWRSLGRLGSLRRSGALWHEVSHCLGQLLCRSEALCEPFHKSRKGTLSASLISLSIKHRWRLSTTRLAMDLTIAWAVVLVAHKARSVHLRSSLNAVGSGPASSMYRRSWAWKTWRNGVKYRGRLSSRCVGASSEIWNFPTGLGWVGSLWRPTDGRGQAEMCGQRLIERRQFPVALFLSSVYWSEVGWRGSTWVGRVGACHDLVSSLWISGKNGEARWWGAWWRPGRIHSSRRLRAGSSGGDHSRPSSWQDAEKFGVRAWLRLAGFARLREGRAIDWARHLLSIKCRQWHAVIKDLIFTSPERDHVARSRRGMLVCTGVEDGISLSWGREWGTQDLIRRKLGALWSSARLFFPHKSQGGRKREGARGRVTL